MENSHTLKINFAYDLHLNWRDNYDTARRQQRAATRYSQAITVTLFLQKQLASALWKRTAL